MNQILISEKIYVTPELKRKKKLYKFNFVVSIILVVVLFGYYVYAEYDRNSADKSQEILSGLKVVDQSVDTTIADSTIKLNDDILVVVLDEKLDNEPQEEINLDKLLTNFPSRMSYKDIPKFPSISKDIAFIFKKDVTAGEVMTTIKKAGGKLF